MTHELFMKALPWAVAVGVAAGGALATYCIYKNRQSAEDPNSYKCLILNQATYGELGGQELAAWFKKKGENAKNPACFLAKPTKETSRMFALTGLPKRLDPETNLLQAVVRESDKKVLAVRLVSFQSLHPQIKSMFGDREYVIFK